MGRSNTNINNQIIEDIKQNIWGDKKTDIINNLYATPFIIFINEAFTESEP
jgi:hypothetical protein